MLSELPREPARWQLARALEARSNGDKEQAAALLEEVFQEFPDDPMLLIQRAEWRVEDKQVEAGIQDADLALKLAGEDRDWLEIHSSFLQNAGRHELAVEDWKKINVISQRTGKPARESALNGLAYAQALAQLDLDQALMNVEQALELTPDHPMILDTRGYILYLKQDFEAALADFMKSIATLEKIVPREKRSPTDTALESRLASSMPKSVRDMSEPTGRVERIARLVRGLAVIYYHRGLVLLALGREEEANADLKRVRELTGREPDETLF
jgi:tetratricopeptide (TPR) repeat protein